MVKLTDTFTHCIIVNNDVNAQIQYEFECYQDGLIPKIEYLNKVNMILHKYFWEHGIDSMVIYQPKTK